MDAVIIESLSYQYPETASYALQDISLRIQPGEFVSIIGANGAGKTTLCSAIRGFVPHFYEGTLSGTVTVAGKRIADSSIGELAADIGYVFQNPFTQMSGVAASVFDELAYGLGNIGITPSQTVERVERMLEHAELTELRERDPMALSGGQQQRVALASVLVMDQPLLVLDEPTSQLDPQATDEVFELIKSAKQEGRTIVLVEHKMEQVAAYSDRVVLMDKGRIILDGTPAEVFGDPKCVEAGTRLPESFYLKEALSSSGLALPEAPLTIEDLTQAITQQLTKTTEVR